MNNTRQWITLLNQQYAAVSDRNGFDLLLAIRKFVRFLETDPQSRRYLEEMDRIWERDYRGWFNECERIQEALLGLQAEIRTIGDRLQSFIEDETYSISDQNAFDRSKHILVKIREENWYQSWSNQTDDLNLDLLHCEKPISTRTGYMVSHVRGITNGLIMLTKALGIEQQWAITLNAQANILWRQYDSSRWKLKNDWMTSGKCAWEQLKTVVRIMDREIFIDPDSLTFRRIQPLMPWILLVVMYAPSDLEREAKQWLNQPDTKNTDFEKDVEPLIKLYLQHLFVALQFLANSRLTHQYLVERYKARCENYDWKNISKRVLQSIEEESPMEDETGKRPYYEYEELLTLDLARYLHDNGYAVHYTPRDGVHEPDLLGNLSNELYPIVVEAKVVGQPRGKKQGKSWIMSGLRSLLAYLQKYYNDYGVTDGYLIVFRVGNATSPMYTFDQPEWVIGQFTIIPKVINVAPINKKDQPIIIKKEDFLHSIREDSQE